MVNKLFRRTINKSSLQFIILLLLSCCAFNVFAQPANDNCNNASVIAITNGGFGLGKFSSSTDDISTATIQTGETFAPAILVAGQNKKSMWYKFTLPTIRAIRITLLQPGTVITAGDAGFAVYKANTCTPNNSSISTKLTPIGTFGNTYHPCVDSGVYYIQVSSNNNANGNLFIDLNVSDTTGALYDHPSQAYNFGVVTPHNKYIDYTVGCQSIEDASEVCSVLQNASQYHKSTWHTFTTPTYFDYISILLSGTSSYFVNNATVKKFGYTLYKGNAINTPIASLQNVDGCDSLLTNGYYAAYKMYKCGDLEPNTTYSIQLFSHETFYFDIRLGVAVGGTNPTQAPQPISTNFPATNKFNSIASSPNGTATTLTDYLGCNSRHSTTACNPSIPPTGYRFNNKNYNLSTFFTFTLTNAAAVAFYATSPSPTNCGPNLAMRIFKQSLTPSCAGLDMANLVKAIDYSETIDCLLPGDYVVQVAGTDTTIPATSFIYNTITSNSARCLSSNLGSKVSLRLTVSTRQGYNNFSISKAGEIDAFNKTGNVIAPFVNTKTYQSAYDTFGCQNTVRPLDTLCAPTETKAMYRLFNIADSGTVTLSALDYYLNYQLFSGDANALAVSQNAFTYPSVITGLKKQSECLNYYTNCNYKTMCVTPGTYTLATYGTIADVGRNDRPSITYNLVSTNHYKPDLAQNMGSILDSVPIGGGSRKSDIDYFSCKDNAVAINGYIPCKISNIAATKAIYRQFYLKDDALVSITNNGSCGYASGMHTLFKGKATDGLAGLTAMGGRWSCFNSSSYTGCDLLQDGWYTVVSYGSGPTYENPLQNVNQVNGYGSYVGQKDEFTITVTVCASPKYNRPFKASIDKTTLQPYFLEPKARISHTPAFPRTDTLYTFATENFNCVDDTPYINKALLACDTTMTKAAYYVFTTTRPTYIEINTGAYWGMVYPMDIRKDSALLNTLAPIQPCVKGAGKIQLCSLPAGTYTLVILANKAAVCSGVTPSVYVDQIGVSRFDFANKAYDFGIVPPDSLWHNGKVGEVNPLNPLRGGSNDFFYCTTGTAASDPTNAKCMSDDVYNMYDPAKTYMYAGNQGNSVNIVRRNLWFTFVVDKPGKVTLKVINKTPGKNHRYRFAVYRSDVNGNLDFATVVATGQVDSTLGQGLTHLGNNGWPNYCNAIENVSFYRDPCTQFAPERYYVVVENRNPYAYGGRDDMTPNNQLEVSILLDSVNLVPTKYDHYSLAYDFGKVGVGTHTGGSDNFSCATRDAGDPIVSASGCNKTLWYKFTSTITGNVRYRVKVNGVIKYTYPNIQLFEVVKDNDSTSKGLVYQSGASYYDNASRTYWSQHCISPGTWYLILPGCSQVNENVFPEIELVEQEGDFCSRPVITTLNGPGTSVLPVIINCHTIGTDYGEFNPTLSCPVNAVTNKYKSSWFRLDITGNDSLDITAFLTENTNVQPADIKYRLMTGDCNAMQEQSCVLDAQTQNTYKCLVKGSYYFQVFTPVTTTPTGSTLVTGDISLHLSAKIHADTCAPINNCLANANFIPQFDCNTDTAVRFVNYSTYGAAISYQWNFGYNGQTSTAVSPAFEYPALATPQTYNVSLKITNTTCNGSDSVTIPVLIPARPYFNLGNDTALCNGGSITLNATTWPGATYKWSTNATTPSINTTGTGVRTYWVKTTYQSCSKADTIKVYVNTITSRSQVKYLCGNDSVQLNANRSQGETHLWNTGQTTSSIYASLPGIYTDLIEWNGCTVIDTFIIKTAIEPLPADTSVCFNQPLILNASATGATAWQWQNNIRTATLSATTAGLYWVKITFGNCSLTDSVNLASIKPIIVDTLITICNGPTYTLPSGKIVNTSGFYRDTIKYKQGCDSLVSNINLSFNKLTETSFTASVCAGQTYNLAWGETATTTGTYSKILQGSTGCDSLKNTVYLTVRNLQRNNLNAAICGGETYTFPSGKTVNTPGLYNDTLRYNAGCDSLITTVNLSVRPVLKNNTAAAICQGQTYTLPSGLKVSVAGIYNDTIRYSSRCDSLISSITLVVKSLVTNNSSVTICQGTAFMLPSGRTINSAGVYNDTLHYASGCDSVINIFNVSIKQVINQSLSPAICKGSAYTLPTGSLVNASGIYRDTVRYASGCDSLISTIDLVVKDVIIKNSVAIICQGSSYTLPSGLTINIAGIYNDTLRYISGCDSLISIVDLKVNNLTRKVTNAAICDGQSFKLASGLIVTTAGIYNDTLRYSTGCDSLIISTNLSVKKVIKQVLSPSICSGQTYILPSGIIVFAAGSYPDTIKYVSGCDSLVSSVTLNVKTVTKNNISASICEGASYTLPSGLTINKAGVYIDTIRYRSSCDSIITSVTLSINTINRQTIAASICAGQSYTLPNNLTVNTAGVYKDTLRFINGCDSLIRTVNLSVKPVLRVSQTATICQGQSYRLPSGKTINTSGNYIDTIKYTGGCDSLVTTINLSINTVVKKTLAVTICQGNVFILPSGKTINTQGRFYDTLRYAQGCDSVITVVDAILKGVQKRAMNASICSGAIYTLPSGRTVGITGIFNDTLKYSTGCDSLIMQVNLQVSAPKIVTFTPAICEGEAYILPSGISVNTAGTYTSTIKTSVGCDSIIYTTILAVNPNPVIQISKSNDINCILNSATLKATGGKKYVWSPVEGLSNANIPIPVASPSATTLYTVQVTNTYDCISTSQIQLVVQPGDATGGYLLPSAFTPNGDGKNDCFGIKSWGIVSNLQFTVFDRWGTALFSTTDPQKCWDGNYNGQPSGSGTYVYSASAITMCGPVTRKGTIVLIR